MGSKNNMKLPTIDFRKAELKHQGSKEWLFVRDQVYEALVEFGCFEALLDIGVPTETLYEKLKEAFNSPNLGNLDAMLGNSQTSSGYSSNYPNIPNQRRIAIHRALTPGVVDTVSNALWPRQGDPQFCHLVLSHVKSLTEFDEMVIKMVFEKLGVEKCSDEYTKSITTSIVFFKYNKAEESKVLLAPHVDKLLTTILSEHQVSGLQVRKKNGDWLDVQYSSPHSFLFLVNCCLTALTNGRVHSPVHQVIARNKERYSMGLTTVAKEGYIIKAPEELVDEDHPLLYKPFEAIEFQKYCLSKDVIFTGPTLEKFSGV